jgi:DNA-binding NarL/FixJ family response regulator
MDKPPIQCVLIDPHQMVLEALIAQLGQYPQIQVAGAATSVDELLPHLRKLKPDVLVAEVNLPGRGLFDAADDIRVRCPEVRGLVLSGFLADVFLDQALRHGFLGYILKEEPFENLVGAIERVAQREWAFSEQVLKRLTLNASTHQYHVRRDSDLATLTARQIEVLRHLACGQSVKEISQTMKLTQKSVDSHKYRIMNKLGIHDRVLLARFAIREGLMIP